MILTFLYARYENSRPLGGETYRPSERNPPPRSDNYRGYRSPPRRGRTPPPYGDTYTPAADRRRSRSPAYRGRDGGSYRGRLRSPARAYSPRRETRARSPLPRTRRYSRSPVPRARSPLTLKRDPSPYHRPRSPFQRERMPSPTRERYERRDYSPTRSQRHRFPIESNHRHTERSASPARRSEHASRIASPISSRRSSPHVHPDRLANTGSGPHSPAFRGSRVPLAARDSSYRDKSPPRRGYSPVPASPPPEAVPYRTRSPPRRERDDYRNGNTPATWSGVQVVTPQSSGYRNGDSRPPPSGPGGYRDSYVRESPSAPPPSAPISMSAHNRPASASVLSAPTRPRGGSSFAGRDPRDQSYSGPQPHRGGRPLQQSTYHAPPRQPPSDHIPHGPRAHHGPSTPFESSYRAPPPFRSNNSSSTTYPRTQRFNTNHLASVPAIVPGGEALPSTLDPAARKRLAELEEQKKKLQDQIEEKQREKRRGLREWDSKERESRRDGLRSELAEEALEAMSGEGAGTGTAF